MKRVSPPRATLFVAGLFMTGLALGSWAGRAAVARATDPYDGLQRFSRMLSAIQGDYVEDRDPDELLDAAVSGMVSELDPHSRWMSAAAVRELEADTDGRAVGFGMEVAIEEGGVVVLDVVPGSPAEREGLQNGDRILSIDGVELNGLALLEIQKHFKGSRGELSNLEVLRDGWDAPQRLSAQRDAIHTPGTESALMGQIMYVRIVDFQRGCAEELAEDVARMQEEARIPWAGLVLDLRDNTGGLLDEAVKVVDLFLEEGPIVSVRGRHRPEEVHPATSGAFPSEMPVLVLVDGLTASASEIVAGALQEKGRARLVGSKTYGKGSVQQLYRNPDGSALKLTVARYHLPSGAPILARQGLLPDIEVHPVKPGVGAQDRLRDAIVGLDLQRERRDEILALVNTLREPAPRSLRLSWTAQVEQRSTEDPVVARALEELR